jgi:hypothetical protein
MRVYKVVCIEKKDRGTVNFYVPGCKYTSVIGNKDFYLTYEIGETTFPKIGKLFGFDSLENAKEYMTRTCYGRAVFVGEAENVGKPKYLGNPNFIESFWLNKKSKKRLTDFVDAPKGTLSFTSFTPERIVYERP